VLHSPEHPASPLKTISSVPSVVLPINVPHRAMQSPSFAENLSEKVSSSWHEFCPFFIAMLTRVVLMIGALSFGFAQISDKQAKKEIQSKAVKQARKEAQKFKKQGYDVTPGSLPMEKQLEYTWIRLYQRDEKGQPLFLSADGNAVAQTRTAAEMQALEAAKLNLAGQLETFIRAIIEANIANAQLSTEEAASVTEFLTAAKNVIVTSISQVDPAFKIYRNLPNQHVEVNVKILVSRDQVMQEAKKRVREELRERLKGLQEKVDKLLPLQ